LKVHNQWNVEDSSTVHLASSFYKKRPKLAPDPAFRLVKLNEASVATRYPEEIEKLQKDFTRRIVKDILSKGKESVSQR